MDAVVINNVSKRYGSLQAVSNLNLSIRKGEIFGLLGPNGAGKTTTIRMLSGLSRPTSGTISVMGFDVERETVMVKTVIGVVPETSNLYPELTCFDNLLFAGRLYGLSSREAKRRAEELLREFKLTEKQDAFFRSLSGGMKRRLTMAASLIHDPQVIFLDEPTKGLDVMSARALREMIRSLKKRATTILLTTHYLEEADHLCDRIGIIVKGNLITVNTPEALKQSVRTDKVVELRLNPFSSSVKKKLNRLTAIKQINIVGDKLRCTIDNLDIFLSELCLMVKDECLGVESFNTITPTLEDAFVKITGLKREVMLQEKPGGT